MKIRDFAAVFRSYFFFPEKVMKHILFDSLSTEHMTICGIEKKRRRKISKNE